MTPEQFVEKWSEVTTLERATVQSHFNDLCRVLGEKTPHEADPIGEWFAFEKGVEKTGAGRGWADVWKRGCFGWEYKSKSGGHTPTMANALKQLQQYALALESPPLLVVSDIDTIEIHTAFQNAVQETYRIELDELVNPEKLRLLKWLFSEPERLRPKRTRNQITAEAAGKFAELAFQLRSVGHDPEKVAHYLNRILFCMFAEDAGLLRDQLFTELAEKGVEQPANFEIFMSRLFAAMKDGGAFGAEMIDWFNGGLYDNDETIPMTLEQIRTVRDLARMDWSQIEPAIFGSLFERGLDPNKRSQLGAHYTDPESIMRLVNPTVVTPLMAEWDDVKRNISYEIERMEKVKTKSATEKRRNAAKKHLQTFLERLRNFRVLDPACGSGNFLYLSLQALKNIEHRVNIEAEAIGLFRQTPMVGPEAVLGLELNAYAADLARVTVWIGEIQWMLDHGYSLSKEPILKPLENIECRDAILNEDGTEPTWPIADAIVGNPPFLGDKKMNRELGADYVERLRGLYKGRVPGGADFVTYWFEKARDQLVHGKVSRVGLVATSSIRGGRSRQVLERVSSDAEIFVAWSDEDWVNEGAAVRVSLVCFASPDPARAIFLDGKQVNAISVDLTEYRSKGGKEESGFRVTDAKKLKENSGVSFQGVVLIGQFDIEGDQARQWLSEPNPNGKSNSLVLRPLVNGRDITSKSRDRWVVDFGNMDKSEASLYEKPFAHVEEFVKPTRSSNPRKNRRERWWVHGELGTGWRKAVSGKNRYIATSQVSKHRFFVWQHQKVWPHQTVIVFARDDYETFGILHSKFHRIWADRFGTSLEDRPRYTPTTTFETFPFPAGMTPDLSPDAFGNPYGGEVAEKANRLDKLRNEWLNPGSWTELVPEPIGGYPGRVVANPGYEAKWKKRTLTALYNEYPEWLNNAHLELDEAVAKAYGLSTDLSDEDILQSLLELNIERS